MGDMTKFNSAIEYYIFNVLLMCLLISEIFIFFYTRSKQNRTEKIDTRDLGTKWLLYLNFVFCLIISFLCISQKLHLHKRIDVACLLCKNWYVNYSSRDLYSYKSCFNFKKGIYIKCSD